MNNGTYINNIKEYMFSICRYINKGEYSKDMYLVDVVNEYSYDGCYDYYKPINYILISRPDVYNYLLKYEDMSKIYEFVKNTIKNEVINRIDDGKYTNVELYIKDDINQNLQFRSYGNFRSLIDDGIIDSNKDDKRIFTEIKIYNVIPYLIGLYDTQLKKTRYFLNMFSSNILDNIDNPNLSNFNNKYLYEFKGIHSLKYLIEKEDNIHNDKVLKRILNKRYYNKFIRMLIKEYKEDDNFPINPNTSLEDLLGMYNFMNLYDLNKQLNLTKL